ncbi:MAG: hypothetical protein Q8S11_09390 [Daejeonella sp.]|nr:hypothetical protein [Daejeonella sp.]
MAAKIVFIVEKTSTGFSAFALDFETYPVGTTGKNFTELKSNIIEALNLHNEYQGLKQLPKMMLQFRSIYPNSLSIIT